MRAIVVGAALWAEFVIADEIFSASNNKCGRNSSNADAHRFISVCPSERGGDAMIRIEDAPKIVACVARSG
jgi:hypothetical protein